MFPQKGPASSERNILPRINLVHSAVVLNSFTNLSRGNLMLIHFQIKFKMEQVRCRKANKKKERYPVLQEPQDISKQYEQCPVGHPSLLSLVE